jgi:hypothetical protein
MIIVNTETYEIIQGTGFACRDCLGFAGLDVENVLLLTKEGGDYLLCSKCAIERRKGRTCAGCGTEVNEPYLLVCEDEDEAVTFCRSCFIEEIGNTPEEIIERRKEADLSAQCPQPEDQ